MYRHILKKFKRDKDFPERTFILNAFTRALNGNFYDHLEYHFYQEVNNCNEPISILDRSPSVQYRLPKLIVDDSVSLLFGDGHFPTIETGDDDVLRETLEQIKEATNLKSVMIHAATMGSIGSVAILMRITDNYLHFKPISSCYLTPIFSDIKPDQLIGVRERYKVKGRDLFASGYAVEDIKDLDEKEDYWVERIWDETQEIRYIPYPVRNGNEENNEAPKVDLKRSFFHDLGFVPIVWIKNLESDDDIDGQCTFAPALPNVVEIDYQLSQAGRALRYSSDPMLLVKDASPIPEPIKKSPANALKIDPEGDAKYLELNGKGTETVLKYVEELRKIALENVHGNRANPDKLGHAQSGRAIELLYQPLVWLADRLRITYGRGLIQILNMVVAASHKYKINLSQSFVSQDNEGNFVKNLNKNSQITLRWSDWFSTTTYDKLEISQALRTLTDAGIISQETAVKTVSNEYAIPNVQEEIVQIKKELEEKQQMLQPKVTETIQS